jgi:hypothetical protein
MKSGSTLSLLAAASTVSGLHFPVSRVKPRTLPSGLERRGFTILAATGGATLTNTENNIYTTTVQVKGKGQFTIAIIVSGAELIFVLYRRCCFAS